jgi:hypothetical protein
MFKCQYPLNGVSLMALLALRELNKNILRKKKQRRPQSKKNKRGKNPKPEEQEGMPQRRHCPPAKCRGDGNPTRYENIRHRRFDVICVKRKY